MQTVNAFASSSRTSGSASPAGFLKTLFHGGAVKEGSGSW